MHVQGVESGTTQEKLQITRMRVRLVTTAYIKLDFGVFFFRYCMKNLHEDKHLPSKGQLTTNRLAE